MGGVYTKRGLAKELQIDVVSAFDALFDYCQGSHDRCAVLLRFPEVDPLTSMSLRQQLTHNAIGWLHGAADVFAVPVAHLLAVAGVATPIAAADPSSSVRRRELAGMRSLVAERVEEISQSCDGNVSLMRLLIEDDQELEVRHIACNMQIQRRLGWLRAAASAHQLDELELLNRLELFTVTH